MVPPGKKPAGETSNSNKKCKRYFNEHWKEEFTWLEFDYERKLMFCVECRQALVRNKHGKAENAFTVGTDNFQRHALLRHVTSGAHRHALAANREPAAPGARGRAEMRPPGKAEANPAKVAVLATVYCAAKEGVPLEKVPALLELQRFNLCPALLAAERGGCYRPGGARDMQAALAKVLQRETRRRIKASPFVGLLVEETDAAAAAAARGSVAVFGTTVSPRSGRPSAAFLGSFALPAAAALAEATRRFGIPAAKAAWLRAEAPAAPCPLLAEARALPAAPPARRAGPGDYVPRYESAVDAVFRLYGRPAAGGAGPRELRDALEQCGVELEAPRAVPWASLLPAVEALDAAWPALVPLLEREAERSALAQGLCRELKTFHFVAFTKTLLDALPVLRELRAFFGAEEPDLRALEPAVAAAAAALRAQSSAGGHNLRTLLGAAGESRLRHRGVQLAECSPGHLARFERLKQSYLEGLRRSLLESFPGGLLEAVSSFGTIFNPKCYPRSLEDVGGHGVAELDLLLRTYPRAVESERARGDFPLFKRVVLSLGPLSFKELCAKLVHGSSEMHELFPDFAVLAAAALALPLGSALAEKLGRSRELLARGRSRGDGDEGLSDAVKIAVDGPPIGEFDFALAVEYYESTRESGCLAAQVK